MPLSPRERATRARAGGFAVHAKHGSDFIAARARRGFMAKFLREVDPDNRLPEDERQRRAHMALKAHMSRLSLKAAKARRLRATMTPDQYRQYRKANPAVRLG